MALGGIVEAKQFFPKTKGASILLAVSGGSDSVALLLVFQQLKSVLGISRIEIAHVNHGLRGLESDKDEEFVRNIAKNNNLVCHIKKLSCKSLNDKGIEEWARTERYNFFAQLKENEGFNCIATGHTADDQAETMIMRMCRGSGILGLCGISPRRKDGVIRPLLCIKKQELIDWNLKNSQNFCIDSTNCNTLYTRNHVRHEIIPLLQKSNPKAVDHLVLQAEYFTKLWNIVKKEYTIWQQSNVIDHTPSRFSIKISGLIVNPLASEFIAQVLRDHTIEVSEHHVAMVQTLIQRKRGEYLLKGLWRVCVFSDTIEVVHSSEKREYPDYQIAVPGVTNCQPQGCLFSCELMSRTDVQLSYDPLNMTVFLDADHVSGGLIYRQIRKTDLFFPQGGVQEMDCVRFLKNQGIGQNDRERMYVVAKPGGTVVWIVGVRISQEVAITPATDTICKISCKKTG